MRHNSTTPKIFTDVVYFFFFWHINQYRFVLCRFQFIHIYLMHMICKRKLIKLNSSKYCNVASVVEGNPKAPFSIATTLRCRQEHYSILWLVQFTLDPYPISVKQSGKKFHFFTLWYDPTWDWTPSSRTVNEHSAHETNGTVMYHEWFNYTSIICLHTVKWSNGSIAKNSI